MAMEQNYFEREAHCETDEEVVLKQKWDTISAPTKVSDKDSSCFECNICLDSANDPVVTLCGHLYCWPCIYEWLQVKTSSLNSDEQPQNCPVCKAKISVSSLVPLYGHGTSSSESKSKKPNSGVVVPCRPTPSLNTSTTSLNTSTTTSSMHPTQQRHPDFLQSQSRAFHNQLYFPHHYGGYAAIASSSLGGMATASFINPMMEMFGGMALTRVFGSSDTSLFTYPYSQPLTVSSNPRIRRQEVELDKSLNRVSLFLFCCFILCLLLF
ncbi:hypothetical protein LWI29_009086 [Acer saccharum]|uniref:E3 ubiquitin-protein ligase RMA n=1 Tax=Acer saccharum TaxID=4024 RepID=A0AA39T0M1_ACESA|nr:hypothetical protein LWI29_009086 [Acer saccharum]